MGVVSTAAGAPVVESRKLRRDVGMVGLLFASVGSIIGSGWLFGALNASLVAGPASLISWVLGGAAVILLALIHAELGGMYPVAGGSARFPHYAFGSLIGFASGWFANIFGVTSQAIQATATAQARPANASDCMRPLAVMDRWLEAQTPPWDQGDTFDRYSLNGNNKGQLLPNPDSYTAPTKTDPGTGLTVGDNYGQLFTLKSGSSFSGGWFQPVDVPRNGSSDTGANLYRDNLASCNGSAVSIGDYLPTESGNMVGPTNQGIGALIALDPNAQWNSNTHTIDGGCVPTCASFSPRIIALPLFDPDEFQFDSSHNSWPNCPGGGSCVHVTNIIGFFVDHIDASNNVVGYLIRYPGVLTTKPGGVGGPSSFAQVITLVR